MVFVFCIINNSVVARGTDGINKGIFSIFQEEIKGEESGLKFDILNSTYAVFNFIGGFADGRYKLVTYRVKYLGKGIFKIYFLFEKKKKFLRYTETLVLYLWQGKRDIVILTKYGTKRFELPKRIIKIMKTKEGYEIIKSSPVKIFVIPMKYAKLVLKVKRR